MGPDKPFINRVAASGLITIDPADFLPEQEIVPFDLKPFLLQGILLKEKEFRQQLQEHDWWQYSGKTVAAFCSGDALIPHWAWMLAAAYLEPIAAEAFAASPEHVRLQLAERKIAQWPVDEYRGARVIIKGCGSDVPAAVYYRLAAKLRPVVKSLMFGEPCSTVPVYKQKNQSAP